MLIYGIKIKTFNPNTYNNNNWREHAACKGMSTSFFYPEQNDRTHLHTVRKTCNSCPVQQQCLQYAIDNQETQGIWGGMGHRARLIYIRQIRSV